MDTQWRSYKEPRNARRDVLVLCFILSMMLGVAAVYVWGWWLKMLPLLVSNGMLCDPAIESVADFRPELPARRVDTGPPVEYRQGTYETLFHTFHFTQERRVDSTEWRTAPISITYVTHEESIVVVTGVSCLAYACANFCIIALLWRRRSRSVGVVPPDS